METNENKTTNEERIILSFKDGHATLERESDYSNVPTSDIELVNGFLKENSELFENYKIELEKKAIIFKKKEELKNKEDTAESFEAKARAIQNMARGFREDTEGLKEEIKGLGGYSSMKKQNNTKEANK